MSGETKSFYQGFAMAIACLIRDRDEPTVAVGILKSCGISIEDLREAKVDGFDLRPISKAVRES